MAFAVAAEPAAKIGAGTGCENAGAGIAGPRAGMGSEREAAGGGACRWPKLGAWGAKPPDGAGEAGENSAGIAAIARGRANGMMSGAASGARGPVGGGESRGGATTVRS